MSVPDYQSLMLPLLQLLGDGKEYKFRELCDSLAVKLGISESERKEMLPSGAQTIFDNRTAWAKTYMKKAGLLD
ncbi:MAG: restriction endonuclease, partial [Bacteroidetes bacterium]|nr:restriction endonuclease [Bacteroidota bacterium]